MTVIPCGSDDATALSENPYELILQRSNSVQQNLKDILNQNQSVWSKIFGKYIVNDVMPNFSLYRTPYQTDQEDD